MQSVFARILGYLHGHASCIATRYDALPLRASPKAAILSSRTRHGGMGGLHRGSPRSVRFSLVGLPGERRRERPRGRIERSGRHRGNHGQRRGGARRRRLDSARARLPRFTGRDLFFVAWGGCGLSRAADRLRSMRARDIYTFRIVLPLHVGYMGLCAPYRGGGAMSDASRKLRGSRMHRAVRQRRRQRHG